LIHVGDKKYQYSFSYKIASSTGM
jgi:hypothetical protein